MIFPKLTLETTMQVDDKLRLDASLSFATSDSGTITDVEIKPSVSDSFISVFVQDEPEKWYLDWAYEADGTVNPEVRVTTDAPDNRTKTYEITVLTEEEDALFSSDNDLYPYEPDILRYLPVGKNSFIYAHRAAQKKILAYLDEQRIWKEDRSRYTKEDIADKEEFRRWSLFQTLLIIFESIQIASDDVFQEKRQEYENEMRQARNRSSLRLDADGDGTTDITPYNIRSTTLVRR
jgi:hypothetical protein